jgi:O-antigen/teichoic acid export membrane protein
MGLRISKHFLKSSVMYTVAGSLPMASALVLLPFYVAHLSTADFGALSIYFAFSYFIQLLTTYSFDTSLYIHYHEFKSDRLRLASFTSSAFLFMLGIGACVGFLFFVSGDLLFRHVFVEQSIAFRPYGVMAAVTGIFQALFKVHGNLLQTREKPEIYFWSYLSSFTIIASATIAGLYLFPQTLMGPVGGRMLAAVFSGGWALARIFREFGVHFDLPLLRQSFRFNFFTFLYQFFQWVINYFDRFFMVFFLPLGLVGVYDFAFKCLLVLEFVVNGLHNSFYPKVVQTISVQEEKRSTLEVNRYYYGLIAATLVLVFGCILAYPILIDIFISKEEYLRAIDVVPFIALVYIFRAIRLFYLAPYGILKFTEPLSVIYVIISAVKILIMWLTIGQFGLYGVIAASLGAALLEVVMLKVFLRRRFVFRYNLWKVWGTPIVLFLIVIAAEPILGSTAPQIAHAAYLGVCILLLAWVYRNEWKFFLPSKMFR